MKDIKYKSATHYVLSSLMPYTESNLKLTFQPHTFFKDLDKFQRINHKAARTAFTRVIEQGLVEINDDGSVRMTAKGRRKLAPYYSKKLAGAQLMVTFDIPEGERRKRNHLRTLLRELSFLQVQKSVWISDFDHRSLIKAEVDELRLHDYVQVFESRRL